MAEPSIDSRYSRLRLLATNPEVLSSFTVEDVYEDLEVLEAKLLKVCGSLRPDDPKREQFDAAIAAIRGEKGIGFDCDHLDIVDHQGAYEWRVERKKAAIQALTPAILLLGALPGAEGPDILG